MAPTPLKLEERRLEGRGEEDEGATGLVGGRESREGEDEDAWEVEARAGGYAMACLCAEGIATADVGVVPSCEF